MRKFYLENEYAQRFDLQDPYNAAFAFEPGGLGMTNDAGYVRIGDGSFVRNYLHNAQDRISLTMVFAQPSAYDNYQRLVNFALSARTLRLVYIPSTSRQLEYFREVEIASVEKSEIGQDGTLHAPVTFNCFTLYYTANDTKFVVEPIEGESRYDMRYDFMFNDNAAFGVDILNDGHTEAAIQLEVNGPTEYPSLELMDRDGSPIASIDFPYVIQAGETLHYSTRDVALYGYIQHANGSETNIVPTMGLENDNFFKVPIGAASLRLSSATGNLSRAALRILKFYRTV